MLGTGFTSIFLLLLSLIELVIVSRFFTVEVFGVYATTTLILNLISSIGISIVSQFALRRQITVKPSLFGLIFLISNFQLIIGLILEKLILEEVYVLFTYLFFLLNMLVSYFENYKVRIGEISKCNVSQITGAVASLMVLLFFLLLNINVIHVLFLALVVKPLVQLMLIYEKAVISYKFNKRLIVYYKLVCKFYVGYFLSSITGYLYLNIDRWVVSLFLGVNALAFYSRVLQVINVPIVVLNRVISKDIQSKLLHDKLSVYLVSVFLALSIVLSFILKEVFKPLVSTILGDEWLALVNIMEVAIYLIPLRVLLKFVDVYIRAKLSSKVFSQFCFFNLLVLLISFSIMLTTFTKLTIELVIIFNISSLVVILILSAAYLALRHPYVK